MRDMKVHKNPMIELAPTTPGHSRDFLLTLQMWIKSTSS
jgi:hypothetical protein